MGEDFISLSFYHSPSPSSPSVGSFSSPQFFHSFHCYLRGHEETCASSCFWGSQAANPRCSCCFSRSTCTLLKPEQAGLRKIWARLNCTTSERNEPKQPLNKQSSDDVCIISALLQGWSWGSMNVSHSWSPAFQSQRPAGLGVVHRLNSWIFLQVLLLTLSALSEVRYPIWKSQPLYFSSWHSVLWDSFGDIHLQLTFSIAVYLCDQNLY